MTAATHRRLRATVRGRVQGVFFRAWTQETAAGLGLAGWVRNTEDGAVEIVAQGPLSRLQELVERCRRGPAAAKVTAVDVVWEEEVISELSGFHIRR